VYFLNTSANQSTNISAHQSGSFCFQDVGVVVIGRNEGNRLIRCIKSLQSTGLTVIYVDSGSVDGSQDTAKQLGALVEILDLSIPFTAARARNKGFSKLLEAAANIKFVQFIDGDCILDESWLNQARGFLMERLDVAAVCGRRREINPSASIYNWMCDIEWATPIGETDSCGGDVMLRAEPFQVVGGYLSSLVAGEEPELCIRLRNHNWKIWRIDAEMTLHDAAITRFTQWWRRCKRGGYGMCQVAKLHIQSKNGIWKKPVVRAIFYGGFIPMLISLGVFYPPLLSALLFYPAAICKISIQRGYNDTKSWRYAGMITVAKFAEFAGILNFTSDALLMRSRGIFEYK
jgi:glycosyltransferase involved in cell wall biosynthesis